VENAPSKVVQFQVSDLIHPHPAHVLLEMFQHLTLEGEVAAETNDGQASFLVVRVARLADPVIVPLDKAQPVEAADCDPARAADR
jgi:hypothetical protein